MQFKVFHLLIIISVQDHLLHRVKEHKIRPDISPQFEEAKHVDFRLRFTAAHGRIDIVQSEGPAFFGLGVGDHIGQGGRLELELVGGEDFGQEADLLQFDAVLKNEILVNIFYSVPKILYKITTKQPSRSAVIALVTELVCHSMPMSIGH